MKGKRENPRERKLGFWIWRREKESLDVWLVWEGGGRGGKGP